LHGRPVSHRSVSHRPDDQDPRERDLERRSDATAISPWLVIGLIVLLGAAVNVISAMAMR